MRKLVFKSRYLTPYLFGGSLLILAVLCNKWLLAEYFTADGQISSILYLATIYLNQTILTVAGLYLIAGTPKEYLARHGTPAIQIGAILAFGLSLSLAGWIVVVKVVAHASYSNVAPHMIELAIPALKGGAGGIIFGDVNNDGKGDFVITRPGYIAVYDVTGRKLWTKSVNLRVTDRIDYETGLPGAHAPGIQLGDVDGDNNIELVFLINDNVIEVLDAATGDREWQGTVPPAEGSDRWEHVVLANLRGKGERDIVLQGTNAADYAAGLNVVHPHLVAYALDELMVGGDKKALWTRSDFVGAAHSGVRVADIDGDGRDEILGATLLGSNGRLLVALPINGVGPKPHIDAIHVADVRSEFPGLEVVALEEDGENRIFLYNQKGIIWTADYKHWEPQNTAIGDFDVERPGLEIWCRSRFSEHQKPFVFDATGKIMSQYGMDDVRPFGWTIKGVEVISAIHWTGETRQLVAAKERHKAGDVAIFDAITGEFVHRFKARADRLFVADVSGDWREELVVLEGNMLRVYENTEPNPYPDRPRLWTETHYRRSKMTWNYYNP